MVGINHINGVAPDKTGDLTHDVEGIFPCRAYSHKESWDTHIPERLTKRPIDERRDETIKLPGVKPSAEIGNNAFRSAGP